MTATLFTEIVTRTFTGGVCEGLTLEMAIPRISKPREIGSVHEVAKPVAGSPYRDVIVGIERWEG